MITVYEALLKLGLSPKDLAHRKVHVPSEEIADIETGDYMPAAVHIQAHDAHRAGLHQDLRLVVGDSGKAISFVPPKGLPKKTGERRLLIRQPDHTAEYATWEGTIPDGEYGAGTVKLQHSAPAIARTGKDRIDADILRGEHAGRYVFRRLGGTSWLAIRRGDPVHHWEERPPMHNGAEAMLDQPEWAAEKKYDGVHVIARFDADRGISLAARSKSATGNVQGKEAHVPWIRDVKVPREWHGVVARGELYHPEHPFNVVSSILLSKPHTAVQAQHKTGKLQLALFSLVKGPRGKELGPIDYEGQQAALAGLTQATRTPLIHVAEGSMNGTGDFFRQVLENGGEGVVLKHRMTGEQRKLTRFVDLDLKVIGFEPGSGKLSGKGVGSMFLGDRHGRLVARVGSGLTEQMRQDAMKNPEKYMHRLVKVSAKEITQDGSLRHPVFRGFSTDKHQADLLPQDVGGGSYGQDPWRPTDNISAQILPAGGSFGDVSPLAKLAGLAKYALSKRERDKLPPQVGDPVVAFGEFLCHNENSTGGFSDARLDQSYFRKTACTSSGWESQQPMAMALPLLLHGDLPGSCVPADHGENQFLRLPTEREDGTEKHAARYGETWGSLSNLQRVGWNAASGHESEGSLVEELRRSRDYNMRTLERLRDLPEGYGGVSAGAVLGAAGQRARVQSAELSVGHPGRAESKYASKSESVLRGDYDVSERLGSEARNSPSFSDREACAEPAPGEAISQRPYAQRKQARVEARTVPPKVGDKHLVVLEKGRGFKIVAMGEIPGTKNPADQDPFDVIVADSPGGAGGRFHVTIIGKVTDPSGNHKWIATKDGGDLTQEELRQIRAYRAARQELIGKKMKIELPGIKDRQIKVAVGDAAPVLLTALAKSASREMTDLRAANQMREYGRVTDNIPKAQTGGEPVHGWYAPAGAPALVSEPPGNGNHGGWVPSYAGAPASRTGVSTTAPAVTSRVAPPVQPPPLPPVAAARPLPVKAPPVEAPAKSYQGAADRAQSMIQGLGLGMAGLPAGAGRAATKSEAPINHPGFNLAPNLKQTLAPLGEGFADAGHYVAARMTGERVPQFNDVENRTMGQLHSLINRPDFNIGYNPTLTSGGARSSPVGAGYSFGQPSVDYMLGTNTPQALREFAGSTLHEGTHNLARDNPNLADELAAGLPKSKHQPWAKEHYWTESRLDPLVRNQGKDPMFDPATGQMIWPYGKR